MQTHTHADHTPGRKGATRASFDDHNPRELVMRIWEDAGRPTGQHALPKLQERVRKALDNRESDFLDAFIDHTTANCFAAILRDEKTANPPKKRSAPPPLAERIVTQAGQALEAATMLSRAKKAAVNDWLLEQVAPNGKALGDCTGMEGSQFIGFYKAIFSGVGAAQKLRDVKTGDDIAAAITFAV